MSLIAGAVRFDGAPVDAEILEGLAAHLSRSPDDQVKRFPLDFPANANVSPMRGSGFHIEHGVLDGNATVETSSFLVLGAGEPFFRHTPDEVEPRDVDFDRIGKAGANDAQALDELLVTSRGTFQAAVIAKNEARVELVGDLFGVRTLYLWSDGTTFVFASRLGCLEAIDALSKPIDRLGLHEQVAFVGSLDEHTPYATIRMLRGGERLTLSNQGCRSTRYFSWDRVSDEDMSSDERVTLIYERFHEAVARRLSGDKSVMAFLSGGLDSRMIVSVLRERGVDVHALNYAWEGSHERIVADRFARVSGAIPHMILRPRLNDRSYPAHASRTAFDSEYVFDPAPDHRTRVWAGDGGSVICGYVHTSDETIAALRAGDAGEAARAFTRMKPFRLPEAVLAQGERTDLTGFAIRRIAEALTAGGRALTEKSLYHFQIENQERRHLVRYFEELDLVRIEMPLPFFDADFARCFISTPIELGMYHRLYIEWMKRLPSFVFEVPWQAYDRHIASDLPMPEGERQWGALAAEHVQERRRRAVAEYEAGRELRRDVGLSFPKELLSRARLTAALAATKLGRGDYDYLVRTAGLYERFWAISGGRIAERSV
ncbi:MAG: asparagine synthase-related protein [Pseudomonadota bacterium]